MDRQDKPNQIHVRHYCHRCLHPYAQISQICHRPWMGRGGRLVNPKVPQTTTGRRRSPSVS